mgnify:CR=1 FL=1
MYQKEAYEAVEQAKQNTGEWFGDEEHDEQVCFANGVYTVASNGDAQDYSNGDKAAEALMWQWQQEDRKS